MTRTTTRIAIGIVTLTLFGLSIDQVAGAEPEMNKMWDGTVKNATGPGNRGVLFRDGNYPMFIHWGLYSHLGNRWKSKTYYGIGEWIMHPRMAGIPVQEYKAVANEFNPVKFDARQWVKVAKDAGMKYIVITAKHHEGFAMFGSKASSFNIVEATPFHRDPMKELAAACKEAGLGFGFYYSHNQDWTEPGGAGGPTKFPDGRSATFDDYFNNKCLPQVKEITSNYGPMTIIWFDTPGKLSKEQTQQLVDVVRKNQPSALISGRIGMGMGDYTTLGDMEVPLENHEGMWESVDTTNDSWAYAWYDENWKSPKQILMNVISTVARGGTYMLNVGPTGEGVIPQRAADYLRQAGQWIKRYPKVVYAADASPWGHALPWGDVTVQENTLQLAVYDWPRNGKLYLPGLHTSIASAATRNGQSHTATPVTFKQDRDWTIIDVPYEQPDMPISVIELKLKGKPDANAVLGLDPETPLILHSLFADVSGAEKSTKRWMEKFGEWKVAHVIDQWTDKAEVAWPVNVYEPGLYRVSLRYIGVDRLVWSIQTNEGVRTENQLGTTTKYVTHPAGLIEFKTPGHHRISVSLQSGDPKQTALEAIVLQQIR